MTSSTTVAQKSQRGDLVRRVCAALDIAGQVVRGITVQGDEQPQLATLSGLSEKVVAETAMLLLCAASVQDRDAGIRQRVDDVARMIAPLARSDTVLAGICLEPGLARDHALAHIVLGILGFPDADTDRLLSESVRMGSDSGPERLPHRELEQEWLVRLCDDPTERPSPEPGLPSRSALGRPMDALVSTTDDVYAFTHAVMYLSDLGGRRVPLPRSAAAIASDADAALAFSLDRDDFDLTAEVLLTFPMLGIPWSTSASFAFGLLAAAEDDLGFVPGPSFDSQRHHSLADGDRLPYVLMSSYHTEYIWGFLCASALRPGCAPPPLRPGGRGSPGAGELLLALDPDNDSVRWRRASTALPSSEKDAIAPLIVAALLRRAAGAGDLALLHRVLRCAVTNDVVEGPAPKQAAALLHRSAVLDGMRRGVRTPAS